MIYTLGLTRTIVGAVIPYINGTADVIVPGEKEIFEFVVNKVGTRLGVDFRRWNPNVILNVGQGVRQTVMTTVLNKQYWTGLEHFYFLK